MPATVELTRLDGVELAKTGTWETITGTWDFTQDDLQSAVTAWRTCPAVRRPILKIGHTDPRFDFDGEPAIGYVDNMRAAGDTLIGDYVGVPAWLGDIMASAYPDRSIEGTYNHRCQLGHQHQFVINAVSLLGVTPPGVGTLQSLQDVANLFGIAAGTSLAEGEVTIVATIRAAAPPAPVVNTGAMVALIPTRVDAERLALDTGLAADDLHVTLAYLGKAGLLDPLARQQIIDSVSFSVLSYRDGGAPVVDAEAFGAAVFNPPGYQRPDGDDPSTCVVLVLSGEELDDYHRRVRGAVEDSMIRGVDLPDQHEPWNPHLTLAYTEDQAAITAATVRCGPVVFDQLRISFGDEVINIPLAETPAPQDPEADIMASSAQELHDYWVSGQGLGKWVRKTHRWTALYKHLRKYIKDPKEAKRTATEWFHDALGFWPGSKENSVNAAAPSDADLEQELAGLLPSLQPQQLAALITLVEDYLADETSAEVQAAAESRFKKLSRQLAEHGAVNPDALAAWIGRKKYGAEKFSDLAKHKKVKASEGTPPVSGPQETAEGDAMSMGEVRSRLGLADDADDAATLAAVDDLVAKANTPPTPTPEQVAASAAAAAERVELTKQVDLLATQVTTLSEQVAAAHAEKAATVKASVLDAAVAAGKIKPADRDEWSINYDEAPSAVTRVLASIAPGTAVPVTPAGHCGTNETSDETLDAEFDRLFPPAREGASA